MMNNSVERINQLEKALENQHSTTLQAISDRRLLGLEVGILRIIAKLARAGQACGLEWDEALAAWDEVRKEVNDKGCLQRCTPEERTVAGTVHNVSGTATGRKIAPNLAE